MVAAVAVGVAVAGAATSYASSSAQGEALDEAGAAQERAYQENKKFLTESNEKAQENYRPYEQIGRGANNQLAWEMGTGGTEEGFVGTGEKGAIGRDYTPEQYANDPGYTPMVKDLASLQATPGYQYQLEQGLQAVNNSAAAQGSLLSGRQLKAINETAQGVASTGYQAAWERAQSAYSNAFSRDTNNRNNRFNRLQTMGANGQQAATGQAQANIDVGTALAGSATQRGENQAGLALAQGKNTADEYKGYSNAIKSGAAAYTGGY